MTGKGGEKTEQMKNSDAFEKIKKHIEDKFGVRPDYPFEDDTPVFRHADNRKWFAIVIRGVPCSKLDGKSGRTDVINLKCEPLLASCAVDGKRIFPAYHMNKRHWISIPLDGRTDADEICAFADLSYRLTAPKEKK